MGLRYAMGGPTCRNEIAVWAMLLRDAVSGSQLNTCLSILEPLRSKGVHASMPYKFSLTELLGKS